MRQTQPGGLFDLSGRTAIVTGSSKGIGRAIALRLAEHGARVVISSRKPAACEAVAADIRAAGGEACVIPCDVASKPQLQALVDRTIDRWGGIDIAIGNAAANPYFGPSAAMPDAQFDQVMATNLRANWWLSHMVAPGMAARGGGAIIIISSIAGLRGTPMLAAYGISKAADLQLVRGLAVEWGPRNVRCNAIAPGLVRTDFARALWENPEIARARTRDTPLQRIGEADEIAGAAVFLASAAGSYVTGQTLVIDGGATIGAPHLGD